MIPSVPLVLVTNPTRGRRGRRGAPRVRRNHDEEPSESAAWRTIHTLAGQLEGGKRFKPADVAKVARVIRDTAETMLEQLRRGVHTNPRGGVMSENVLAIVYEHADDRKLYVHGFGDADIRLSGGGSNVTIRGMKQNTDVHMRALPSGALSITGGHGQRLWKNFKD